MRRLENDEWYSLNDLNQKYLKQTYLLNILNRNYIRYNIILYNLNLTLDIREKG